MPARGARQHGPRSRGDLPLALGFDVAGTVERVSGGTSRFRPGGAIVGAGLMVMQQVLDTDIETLSSV